LLQVITITTLEIFVTRENGKQTTAIFEFYRTTNNGEIISKLSGVDSLAVYHMIFIVAQFFLLYLICDTVNIT